jgi:hypothetical protein
MAINGMETHDFLKEEEEIREWVIIRKSHG